MVLFLADADDRARKATPCSATAFPLPLVPVLNEALPQSMRFRDYFLPRLAAAHR